MDITGKQIFKVATNGDLEVSVTFEIDFNNPMAVEVINISSRFWGNAPNNNAPFIGHLEYWLKITADHCYYLAMISSFETNTYALVQAMSKEEGFPHLDGRDGITIIDCTFENYDFEDFEILQIEAKANP